MKRWGIGVALMALLLAACGGGGGGGAGGAANPAQGKAVFTGAGGCSACHVVQGVSAGTIGPELTHIATIAATRKPSMSAEDYIRESLEKPSAYVVSGYPDNQMPQDLTTRMLKAKQYSDLLAYLLTLK